MSKRTWFTIGTAALGLGIGVWMWLAKPAPKQLLIRQLQVADMIRVEDQGPSAVEPMDGFWYAHSGLVEPAVVTVSKTDEGYRYFNWLTLPLPEWIGGGNPWFDWEERVLVGEWGAYIHDDSLVAARYPWYGNPRLVDWSKLSGAKLEEFCLKQVEYMGACSHIWLDLYFPVPADWMFDHNYGVRFDVLDTEERKAWTANMEAGLKRIRALVQERKSGSVVLVNGVDSAPPPVFLENAQEAWQPSIALWRKHPKNVLSVDPGRYEDSLLAVWQKYGGTIAVTGSYTATQPFYLRADRLRSRASVNATE